VSDIKSEKNCPQQAVWQDGGLVSSEILLNFAALALVRVAVKAATSPSRHPVGRNFWRPLNR